MTGREARRKAAANDSGSDVRSLKPGVHRRRAGCARLPFMAIVRALLLAALSVLPGFTQEPRLSDRAEAAVGRSGISGGRLGILIYSTQTEAPLYDRDAKKVCKLASNMKLITTACA